MQVETQANDLFTKASRAVDEIITGWWNDTYLSLAFVHGGSTHYSSTQPWKWLHKISGRKKNFQWGLRSVVLRKLCFEVLWYYQLSWWRNLVAVKFSKLAFRALALPQNEIFLRHLFWRRVNAWSGSLHFVDNTKLPFYTLPPTQHHGFLAPLIIRLYFSLSRNICNNN